MIISLNFLSTCPFCHVSRPELQQEVRMEQHYTVECPMLQQCKHCSQVKY